MGIFERLGHTVILRSIRDELKINLNERYFYFKSLIVIHYAHKNLIKTSKERLYSFFKVYKIISKTNLNTLYFGVTGSTTHYYTSLHKKKVALQQGFALIKNFN